MAISELAHFGCNSIAPSARNTLLGVNWDGDGYGIEWRERRLGIEIKDGNRRGRLSELQRTHVPIVQNCVLK